MIRIILHLSALVIIQHSSKPFQLVFTLFLSNFVEIPIELYSSIYFKLLFPHSFYRRNQLYLMDNVNKPKWESRTNHAGYLLQKRRKARTLHTSFGTRSSCFCKRIIGSSIRNISSIPKSKQSNRRSTCWCWWEPSRSVTVSSKKSWDCELQVRLFCGIIEPRKELRLCLKLFRFVI